MSGSAQKEQAFGSAPCRDSAPLLAALGALAYAASMMTHEALGHGGYCLAAGGHNTMLTPWWESCRFPGAPRLGIKAAGPAVQFGAGLLAWLALNRVCSNATGLRCFLWLYMTFDLLVSSGYVAFSGVTNAGDAAELLALMHARFVFRGGLILFGSVFYFLSMRLAAYELKRFAGPDDGMPRLYRIVWIPYVSAGVLACCTAAINQNIGHGASGLAVASPGLNRMVGSMGLAVASSFGAGLGMFGLPPMQRTEHRYSSGAIYVGWSSAWAIAAVVVILLFLFYIGPGLR